MSESDPHQGQSIFMAGQPLESAQAAMILVHGRGASAQSILTLAEDLPHPGFVYFAPQAQDYTWYPYPFMNPLEQNEPYLSSALRLLGNLVTHIEVAGIPAERIVIGGFSQGACLSSEFVARNARRWGGLFALSGGLIGPDGTPRDYPGSLDGTPIFAGCGDRDAHIPQARVHETAAVFEQLGGQVTERIYPGMGHQINQDELEYLRQLVALVAS